MKIKNGTLLEMTYMTKWAPRLGMKTIKIRGMTKKERPTRGSMINEALKINNTTNGPH